MDTASWTQLTQRYRAAVDSLVEKLQRDPNVIAVLLCGSLAYDKVWHKSDVDMALIIRDQPYTTKSYALDEDGIVLNVRLYTRSEFVRGMGSMIGGGFEHSYYARGKFVYTTDPSLPDLLDDFRRLGSDDADLALFALTSYVIGTLEKVEKWLTVRGDVLYAQYYLTKAADLLADLKLVELGETTAREAVLKASELAPGFIDPFYTDPLTRAMSHGEVALALRTAWAYLETLAPRLARPVIAHMEVGRAYTVTELCSFFRMDSHGITHTFEFLVSLGMLERVSQTIRITPKGKKAAEEVAFLYLGEP